MPEKSAARVCGVSPVGEMVEGLWRKRFVEKMRFQPGVEERSSNIKQSVIDTKQKSCH